MTMAHARHAPRVAHRGHLADRYRHPVHRQAGRRLPWGQAWPMLVILVGVGGLRVCRPGWALRCGRYLGRSPGRSPGSSSGRPAPEHDRESSVRMPVTSSRVLAVGARHPRRVVHHRRLRPGRSPPDRNAGPPARWRRRREHPDRVRGGHAHGRTPLPPGNLADGAFDGGVTIGRAVRPRRARPGHDLRPAVARPSSDWDVGLTAEVPLDLRVDAGASRIMLDLRDVRVRALELQSGASEARVVLPQAAGCHDGPAQRPERRR